MLRYVLVAGTHGATRQNDFDAPGSKFRAVLDNYAQPVSVDRPFMWSTAYDGLDSKNIEWIAGGAALYTYCVPPLCPEHRVKPDELLVIAFSHGVQVALHAFAMGLRGRLISVNPPIRKDIYPVARIARPNLIRWTNIYGNWRDRWAVLGALFDGQVSFRKDYPSGFCDEQHLVPAGHGAALRDEKYFHLWKGWVTR